MWWKFYISLHSFNCFFKWQFYLKSVWIKVYANTFRKTLLIALNFENILQYYSQFTVFSIDDITKQKYISIQEFSILKTSRTLTERSVNPHSLSNIFKSFELYVFQYVAPVFPNIYKFKILLFFYENWYFSFSESPFRPSYISWTF